MTKTLIPSGRADVYTRVTAEIIAAIEAGTGEWRMPWHHDGRSTARPTNIASSRGYRGINRLALWMAAMSRGYASGVWGTYRQWLAAGGQVRKGERATTVVLWKDIKSARDNDDHNGTDEDGDRRSRMFARAFSVFNAQQVDGYELKAAAMPSLPETERLPHAEAFIANLGIRTIFGGSEAYYVPSRDTVHMPPFALFRDAASFYGCWIHENGHGTGAKHRLDRDLTGRFGSAAYAADECCVEILSGLILADLGVAHHPRPDHAAYISSWIDVLKTDPRAIFTAASKAQQAADWMHAQQPNGEAQDANPTHGAPSPSERSQDVLPFGSGDSVPVDDASAQLKGLGPDSGMQRGRPDWDAELRPREEGSWGFRDGLRAERESPGARHGAHPDGRCSEDHP